MLQELDGARQDARSPLEPSWSEMPAEAQQRILLAPETYRRVIYRSSCSPQETRSFLENSIAAEWARIGGGADSRAHSTSGVWTALGDYYFPAGLHPAGAAPNDASPYVAPRIHGEAILDAFSPYSWVTTQTDAEPMLSHTPAELRLVEARIDEAWKGVLAVHPPVSEMVRTFIRVISVKKSQGEAVNFGSSSWGRYVGKTGLTNCHTPYTSVARIMNALVHEMIHSVLYVVERVEPFRLHSRALEAITIRSPWSGRELPVPSFLHACFVWYGLWNFWMLHELMPVVPSPDANEMLERARIGFHGPSLPDLLKNIHHELSESVLSAIAVMQDEVTGTAA